MKIEGSTALPFPQEKVWQCLNDPEVLRLSVPDCESLQASGADKFVATVVAQVGPIKARFSGDAVISNKQAPHSYTLTASGKGGLAGFASADIDVNLSSKSGETVLDYVVAANLGGKLAQLGTRMIESTARKWADDFFRRFGVVVANGGAAPEELLVPAAGEGMGVFARLMLFLRSLFGFNSSAQQGEQPDAKSTERSAETDAAVVVAEHVKPVKRERALSTGYIDVDIGDRVAQITLNRPELKNCMTLGMWQEVAQIFEDLHDNCDVRCVVLGGAGGNFCSGADISEFGEVRATPEQVHHYEQAVDDASDAILNCGKPVIAAVEGYCVGGGLGLAMACDFRVAMPGAKLFIPAAKMSIVYGLRETQTLLALVGLTQAKRILYTGERLDSGEALRIGLLDEVSTEASMAEALQSWLEKFRAAAPLTVSGSKSILNSLEITVSESARIEAEALIKAAGESHDYHEGRAAFAEKRAPEFKGC